MPRLIQTWYVAPAGMAVVPPTAKLVLEAPANETLCLGPSELLVVFCVYF